MLDLQRLIDAQDRLSAEFVVLEQMMNAPITDSTTSQHLSLTLQQAKRVTRASRLVTQALAILRDEHNELQPGGTST